MDIEQCITLFMSQKTEIWHDSDKKTVVLHYVPEDNYSDKDVKIEVPYDQFEDLVKFIIKIR